MKIYKLYGFDFDLQDYGKSVVAEIFKTREEAEEKMRSYQRKAQGLIDSWKNAGSRESVCYHHGKPEYYSLTLSFQIEDKEQRKAWVSYMTDDNIKDEQIKWNDDDIVCTYKEYIIVSLFIKEIEL